MLKIKVVKIINILLIIIVVGLSFYAINFNYKIYDLYHKNIKIKQAYLKNKQINNQLKLELAEKTSHTFIDKFAKENLKMIKPKKIHTLR